MAEFNIILASKLCTRVYYIERGEIIASGTPQEVLAKITICYILDHKLLILTRRAPKAMG